MKYYSEILKNNDPLHIELLDGVITLSTDGNSFQGVTANEVLMETQHKRISNTNLLKHIDEKGLLTIEFCECCFAPVNEGEGFCQSCRGQQALSEMIED